MNTTVTKYDAPYFHHPLRYFPTAVRCASGALGGYGYLLGPRGSRSVRISPGPQTAPTQYIAGVSTRKLVFGCDRGSATPVPGPYLPANGSSTPQITAWQSTFGPTSGWHWKGFEWESSPLIGTAIGGQLWMEGRQSSLRIPFWALLIMFAIMPTWFWLSYRNRRRRENRQGLCPICDYDLRASKERCPECGTPIAQPESPTQTEYTA